MPIYDFQLFLLCRNAHNVAMELANSSKSPDKHGTTKTIMINKEAYLQGV